MRLIRTSVLAGAATLLVAGAAVAATGKFHTMNVDLPDGSVAHIHYAGDVAPKVDIQPADERNIAFVDPFADTAFPAFADFDRISAMMERQTQAMMQQVAQMEHAAASGKAPGQVLVSGNLPAGSSVRYSFYSSSNGKQSCTQTVEWQSDGSGAKPKITRTSSGDCDAVKRDGKPIPASSEELSAHAEGNAV